MPIAFILGLIVSTAAGVAAWTKTQGQVDRNTEEIRDLKTEMRVTRDTLAEIRGDVKYLVRDKRREEESK